jgi:hypothetical protein
MRTELEWTSILVQVTLSGSNCCQRTDHFVRTVLVYVNTSYVVPLTSLVLGYSSAIHHKKKCLLCPSLSCEDVGTPYYVDVMV